MATDDHDPAAYGDGCAAFYDRIYPPPGRAMIATLRQLAGHGPALELGVATGRVAIPLARSGIAVHGIEVSTSMLTELRQRPGADQVAVIHGDFAHDCLEHRYPLIFALVGTLSLLTTRDAQQSCLRNVCAHLENHGVFVYEGHEPTDTDTPTGPERHVHTLQFGDNQHDYAVTTLPIPLPVLDALAAAAGLRLHVRWKDWRQSAHGGGAGRHVSVFRREADIDTCCKGCRHCATAT